MVHRQFKKAQLESQVSKWGRACVEMTCLSTADLPPKGEALPASVRHSSANLGKSILSQSVDIGNDLFPQTELSSSEVTWRIASERQNIAFHTVEISSGHSQYLTEKHTYRCIRNLLK